MCTDGRGLKLPRVLRRTFLTSSGIVGVVCKQMACEVFAGERFMSISRSLLLLPFTALVLLTSSALQAQVPDQRWSDRIQSAHPIVLGRGVTKLTSAQQTGDSDSTDQKSSDQNGDSEASPMARQESLTPLQDQELTIEVRVVSISMDSIGTGQLPESARYADAREAQWLPDGISRGVSSKPVYWRPSLVFHHPLHWEDAMLERHGHQRWGHLQPLVSGAKFFGVIALHPYLHTLNRPWECQYALGNYRPGSCAPVVKDHLPWDKRAAAVQTLATAGFFWAAPM
jgi:hypothetical protein